MDSSGWVEFFGAGRNAAKFRGAMLAVGELIVPTLCIHEVSKWLRSQSDESIDEAMVTMKAGRLAVLDTSTALLASEISQQEGFAAGDGMILATARIHEATLWTQDTDFEGMERVVYVPKS